MPRGGKREGAGRPKRTDGRSGKLYQVTVNETEAALILDLTPDERRKALLAYLEQNRVDNNEC